ATYRFYRGRCRPGAATTPANAGNNSRKMAMPPRQHPEKKTGIERNGGEGGIRTHDTGIPYTHFPGVRLRPLGHLTSGGNISRDASGRNPGHPRPGVLPSTAVSAKLRSRLACVGTGGGVMI